MGYPTSFAPFSFQLILFEKFNTHFHLYVLILSILPVELHSSKENDLSERNHLAKNKPDINHLDIIGGGKPSILLMKMVVITSMVVRFTLKAASKKKGLRKVVANVIAVRRREGK